MSDDVEVGSIIEITQTNSERGWKFWKGSLVVVNRVASWGIVGEIRGLQGIYPIRVESGGFKVVGRIGHENTR